MLFILTSLYSCGQDGKETTKKDGKTSFDVSKSEDEWKKSLTEEQYYILREKGTERPYSGKLLLNKDKGIYKCAACGNELFTDGMKFESHCGWPSFDREIAGGKVIQKQDTSHGMFRTEIVCARCGGHLGHIFNDGPTETGMRYCVNSLSLEFEPSSPAERQETTSNIDTITLGGGCFWCVEAIYDNLDGVESTSSGYSGGESKKVTYNEVCSGTTNHAEVVQIVYDKTKTSLDEIFQVFFTVHDPTTLNRQGADVGTQYRSVIFYRNEAQKKAAESIIADLTKEKVFDNPIVTQVVPFNHFIEAEKYHQDYYNNNKSQPYCQAVIRPKMEKFEKVFHDRLKNK